MPRTNVIALGAVCAVALGVLVFVRTGGAPSGRAIGVLDGAAEAAADEILVAASGTLTAWLDPASGSVALQSSSVTDFGTVGSVRVGPERLGAGLVVQLDGAGLRVGSLRIEEGCSAVIEPVGSVAAPVAVGRTSGPQGMAAGAPDGTAWDLAWCGPDGCSAQALEVTALKDGTLKLATGSQALLGSGTPRCSAVSATTVVRLRAGGLTKTRGAVPEMGEGAGGRGTARAEAQGCPVPTDHIWIVRDGRYQSYDERTVSLADAGDSLILDAVGARDPSPTAPDDEYADHVRVVLDKGALADLQPCVVYDIDGTGSWSQAGDDGSVGPEQLVFRPTGHRVVSSLGFFHDCLCDGDSHGQQQWVGTLELSHIGRDRVAGVLQLTMIGAVPGLGSNGHDLTITASFNKALGKPAP